ncbi:MAG: non-hydrolyzing UDP-N-acetylglucosamine 2-epimerase [Candidatus Scalinduaceae bacterium]
MKIILIAGARPNFMKIAPLIKVIELHNENKKNHKPGVNLLLVHTGQHYDEAMSTVFFDELNIPRPDINLGIGSGGHGKQTGKIMIAFEKVVLEQKPDLVIVVGDVNSTIACAMVAAKLNIPVAHVEAGLRSFDRSMPEEINRILTDQISDFLFTHSPEANANLLKEGIPKEKIFFVGNIMIDSLSLILQYTSNSEILKKLKEIVPLKDEEKSEYALLTLHRPSNVDHKNILERVLNCFGEISKKIPILFPVHPRTKKQIEGFGLSNKLTWLNEDFQPLNGSGKNYFYGLPPLGYLDFMFLEKKAKVMFTDSGGTQEETTILGTPCITLRENTERPVTITEGTNTLVGNVPARIIKAFENAISTRQIEKKTPRFWDGKTAERIIDILTSKLD